MSRTISQAVYSRNSCLSANSQHERSTWTSFCNMPPNVYLFGAVWMKLLVISNKSVKTFRSPFCSKHYSIMFKTISTRSQCSLSTNCRSASCGKALRFNKLITKEGNQHRFELSQSIWCFTLANCSATSIGSLKELSLSIRTLLSKSSISWTQIILRFDSTLANLLRLISLLIFCLLRLMAKSSLF